MNHFTLFYVLLLKWKTDDLMKRANIHDFHKFSFTVVFFCSPLVHYPQIFLKTHCTPCRDMSSFQLVFIWEMSALVQKILFNGFQTSNK